MPTKTHSAPFVVEGHVLIPVLIECVEVAYLFLFLCSLLQAPPSPLRGKGGGRASS